MNITTRLEKAIRVAAIAHSNQIRKGSDTPYVVHPFNVMCLADEVTKDEDILIACLFHDIIEDVPDKYPRDTMLEEFGERVVSIVDGVTKDSTIKDWKKRSEAYLYHLEHNASDDSVLVSCADKTHNLMSILEDYRTLGEELWSHFHSDKKQQLWFYESALRVTSKRRPDLNLNKRLAGLVEEFQGLT